MRLHLIVLAALPLMAGCASKEYTSVPDPAGDWVVLNPPGFQGPVVAPARPLFRRAVRVRPRRLAVTIHTAQAAP